MPPFAQFKNQAKFEVEFKRKVVDFVKMYNFGVLSFWSFNIKFKVILKIQISRKCSLFQFESPIQILFGILKSDQHESCRAQNVEQLSSCLEKSKVISSCLEKSKVILEFLFCPNLNQFCGFAKFAQILNWRQNSTKMKVVQNFTSYKTPFGDQS